MRRAPVKAGENDMTISAYTRLEQMRAEIEAVHKMAIESQARAEAATNKADHILKSDDIDNDAVVSRVNTLIEQATTRPN